MAELTRLPRGFKPKLMETKELLINAVNNINKSGLNINKKLEWIKSVYEVCETYMYQNNEGRVLLNYKFITTEFIYGINNGKFRLSEKCTVYIPDTDDFIIDYKW